MGLLDALPDNGLLIPCADGRLQGAALFTTAFMAPRLQATLDTDNTLRISLWGGGDLGALRIRQDWQAPFLYGPNTIETANHGGVYVAQSQPVILIRRAIAGRFTPARKPAKWATSTAAARCLRNDNGLLYQMPWGHLCIQPRGENIVIAAGADAAECLAALAISDTEIEVEAKRHAARCDKMPQTPPLLRSMVLNGVHTAMASRRYLSGGRFAGLAAGMNYSFPSRTYYRDGHWTLQALLHTDPDIVPQQIALLAEGIHADGEAPSGIISADAAQMESWNAFRLSNPQETAAHQGPRDWWSDHTDSPLFFIIGIGDYCKTTGDATLFKTYLPQIEAVFRRYMVMAGNGNGLPRKPRHDRDWADNVFRAGDVAYIAGLWIAALNVLRQLGQGVLATEAQACHAQAVAALPRLATCHGWPCNYADTDADAVEDNLSLDALTLCMADAPDSNALLAHIGRTLDTRHNAGQPWGDWGVMCAWPAYGRRRDLRGKTVFPYRYHNGSDWPWLDGLYAREMLRRNMDGWDYPLLRWWSYGLAQGWTSPVEYYSPRYGRGSLLQGWSSLPAAAALSYTDIILRKTKR